MTYETVAEHGMYHLLRLGDTWRIVAVDVEADQVRSAPGDHPPADTGASEYFARWTDRGIESVSQPLTEAEARERWAWITGQEDRVIEWCECRTPLPDKIDGTCYECDRLVKSEHERLRKRREEWLANQD